MAATEPQLCLDLETDYAEVIISVGKVMFGERQRKENQSKELESEVLKLTRAACALLNSGGGMIRASIANQGYSSVQDGIGQDIQRAFQECIHSEELSEYFDFIQEGQLLMIWVKAWSSANSSKPRICSVKTGLHQRNGEFATQLKDLTFLKEKLAYAEHDSENEMSPKKPRLQKPHLQDNIWGSVRGAIEMSDGIQKAAAQLFKGDQLEYGETLGFTEWTMVEFKDFPRGQHGLNFVRNTLPRYVSAFANTQGGYIIFGVDRHRKVVGCKQNLNPTQVRAVVATTIDAMPCFPLDASKPKVDYEFKALAVCDKLGKGHGYVFVVRIKSFRGVVFSEEPDSWIVEADCLKRSEIAEWLKMMTAEDPETDYAEVILSLGKVTFGEHQRKEEKKSKKLEQENEVLKLTQAACALLNSGGGMIRASIANQGYSSVQDGIGRDIQRAFQECIHSEELSEYFDFIQEGQLLMIWVKAWSSANSSKPRICSVKTGLHQRNGESAMQLKDLTFLKEKLAYAKQNPENVMSPKRPRLQSNSNGSVGGAVEMSDGIWKATAQFFERDKLEYGEILGFTEWTMVEFKDFPREEDKDSLDFIRKKLLRYVSAFANTQGGYIIFGVEDKHRKVVGCKTNLNPTQVRAVVATAIDAMPCFPLDASKPKVDYEFKAQAVCDKFGEGHGYVFVVRIQSFRGIVFSEEPDSWIVEADCLKRSEIAEWLTMMTAEDPDLSRLAEQFTTELSLSDGPPMIKPVYSVRGLDSLDELRRKLFPGESSRMTFLPQSLSDKLTEYPGLKALLESNRMIFVPQSLCDKLLEYPGLKALLKSEIEPPLRGTWMFSDSWAVNIGLPKNQAVVCDALLMAVGHYPVLYTIVENLTSDVYEYSRHTARQLKQKLVNVGGYTQKICVIPKVLTLQPTDEQNAGDQRQQYPKAYQLRQEHLPGLQKALVTALLGFTSFLSDYIGVEFLNLLTLEQYEKLSTRLEETRLQFIYGIPGSGKTVVALKIMEKIKNEFGCKPDEILYICENKPLQNFVRKKAYRAVTRATFMKGEFPEVKHIVVDEAQNFREEHGAWYKKASNIVNRNSNAPGIFWIFLDYFQMSHPFNNGLPSQQYPKDYLTKGVRNASTIYNVVRREMEKIVEVEQLDSPHQDQLRTLLDRTCCSNSVAGSCHVKNRMEGREIAHYVARQCQKYLDQGYSKKDIAILCSTKETTSYYQPLLVQEMRKLRLDVCFVQADDILEDKIVLDSIRRFSGLERTIVFGIDPVPTQEKISHNPVPMQEKIARNLLLCVASRANQQLHLLYANEQVSES